MSTLLINYKINVYKILLSSLLFGKLSNTAANGDTCNGCRICFGFFMRVVLSGRLAAYY